MIVFTLIVAMIALLTGLSLLWAPDVLQRLGSVLNRDFTIDDVIFANRKVFGLLFLLIGFYLVFLFFRM